ncbi:alkaline shock response membrane anchor protein AmaP [Enterococcus sp. CSURQ0835]|uniref:alkaline shock response membrane anchor protein AmaP n=1 Tax=Enterococcus sp. CSURQ0835 TaxID=2681394 RepID=UPI00135A9D2E|nr:alkaline shock response membrane anchor protein AmaP [Enterococcus sp. CSURQ0835]
MNKGIKFLLIIGTLFLMSIFIAVAVVNQSIVNIPFDFGPARHFTLTNFYLRQYLFWAAVVVLILLLIALLVIIFYPKTRNQFMLKNNQGKLLVDKKAIEGLVQTSIDQNDFVDTPKVNVKATKNKIKINVKGQLKKTSSLIAQTERWATGVEQQIKNLLGSGEKVAVNVNFTSFEDEKRMQQAQSQPRVE